MDQGNGEWTYLVFFFFLRKNENILFYTRKQYIFLFPKSLTYIQPLYIETIVCVYIYIGTHIVKVIFFLLKYNTVLRNCIICFKC